MKRYLKSDLQREMRRFCKEKLSRKIYKHCAAEINGTFMYLDENEVRYLQVKCSLCKSDEEFEDFTKSHIIYDRATKRGANRMVWQRNGCFANDFQKGFFDTTFLLTLELL